MQYDMYDMAMVFSTVLAQGGLGVGSAQLVSL